MAARGREERERSLSAKTTPDGGFLSMGGRKEKMVAEARTESTLVSRLTAELRAERAVRAAAEDQSKTLRAEMEQVRALRLLQFGSPI